MSSSSTAVPPAVAALPADLDAGLRRLKLATVRRTAAEVLQTAKTQRWTPEEVLRTLIEAELAARDASNIAARLKAAAFPVAKTLDSFIVAESSIPQATFDYLIGLEWVRSHANLALVGPPGTGKSHTLIGLGIAAVHAGHKVRYFTAADLVEALYRGLADTPPSTTCRGHPHRRQDHRHAVAGRSDHRRRGRVRAAGRHRHPVAVPTRRRRLRTPIPGGRLALAVRAVGPVPARTHHRRRHPRPALAPRHRRAHRR